MSKSALGSEENLHIAKQCVHLEDASALEYLYKKDKPNKYGIKLYALTDAESGFVLTAEIYTRKLENDKDNSIQGIFERLCAHFINKGHATDTGRFYSNGDLFDRLFSQKTMAMGTLQKKQGEMPKALVNPKLNSREVTHHRCESML